MSAAKPSLEPLAVDCRWFHKFKVVEVEVRGQEEGEGGGEKVERKRLLRGYCSLGIHKVLGRMVDHEYCSKCSLRVGVGERRPPQWAVEIARRVIMRGIIPSSWEELG